MNTELTRPVQKQTESVSSFEEMAYIGVQPETVVQQKEEIIATLRYNGRARLVHAVPGHCARPRGTNASSTETAGDWVSS